MRWRHHEEKHEGHQSRGQLAEIALSRDELLLVNNALNEVCNGIDMFEFATRLGAGRDRVAALLAEVRSLIESMPPDGST